MKLIFDSLDEARAFMDDIDGDDSGATATEGQPATTRRRRGPNKPKGEAAPIGTGGTAGNGATAGFQPPPTGPAASGFPSAAPAASGFPGNPPPVQTHPLVAQIVGKVDATLAAGQPLDPIVAWFRTALPGTEQANWEQMKAAFLPKAPEATLVNIAGQLGLLTPAAQ